MKALLKNWKAIIALLLVAAAAFDTLMFTAPQSRNMSPSRPS